VGLGRLAMDTKRLNNLQCNIMQENINIQYTSIEGFTCGDHPEMDI